MYRRYSEEELVDLLIDVQTGYISCREGAKRIIDNGVEEEITAERFEIATGRKPINDDLERSNCPKRGMPGHMSCGWNHKYNLPIFMAPEED